MLKRTITFEDLDGNSITEDFYFSLSKADLVELQLSTDKGFAETLQEIVKERDGAKIIAHFKRLILMSYGQRSEDGRRFIKDEQKSLEFSQTDAYSQLFIELATNSDQAAEFVRAIIPSSMASELETSKVEATKTEVMAAIDSVDASKNEFALSWSSYSDIELLKMPDEQFNKLMESSKGELTREQLLIAMKRKNSV